MSPYEAVLRSFGYLRAGHPRGARHGALRSGTGGAQGAGERRCLGDAGVAVPPGARAGLQPSGLIPSAGGSDAARRAVEAAPSSHLALISPGPGACSSRRNSRAFRNAAERALALNPMDGNSIAFLGELLTYTGDSERGCALAERASSSIPIIPGGTGTPHFYDAYRRGDDRGALEFALKINLPGHWVHTWLRPPPAGSSVSVRGRESPARVARAAAGLRGDRARATWRSGGAPELRRAPDRRVAQGGPGHSAPLQAGTVKPDTTVAKPEAPSRSRCCRSPT